MSDFSHYKPEYLGKVDEYLNSCKDRNVKVIKTKSDKKGFVTYENKLKVKIPTKTEFAKILGVRKKTILAWGKLNQDFGMALNRIHSEQKQKVLNKGLSGEYNPLIARLILSTNHGMKERHDNTTNDKDLNSFSDEQSKRIAGRVTRGENGNDSTPGTKESS